MKVLHLLLTVAFARVTDKQSLQILTLGDWGGQLTDPYYTQQQVDDAAGMAIVGKKVGVDYVLALGDNFYMKGIPDDVNSIRFQATWNKVYTQDALQVPWFVIAGNHDHYGNVTAQIAYSDVDKRWNYPNNWYTQSWSFSGSEGGDDYHVDVIFFDAVVLAGDSYYDEENDVAYASQGPLDEDLAKDQWAFIEKALNESTADFLFLASHYPVYSVCTHGPTGQLVRDLVPLMKAANVTGYLSGHDHCLNHFEVEGEPAYILTGNGHDCCYSVHNHTSIPEGALLFNVTKGNKNSINPSGHVVESGFGHLNITKDGLIVTYYDDSATALYTSRTFPPRYNPARA